MAATTAHDDVFRKVASKQQLRLILTFPVVKPNEVMQQSSLLVTLPVCSQRRRYFRQVSLCKNNPTSVGAVLGMRELQPSLVVTLPRVYFSAAKSHYDRTRGVARGGDYRSQLSF